MKRFGVVSLALLSVWIVSAPVAAQQARNRDNRNDRGDDRVCFYHDVQYQGGELCYRPGEEMADLRSQGDEISSIRVFGRARVIVYERDGFSGFSDEFDMDVPDLRQRNMDGSRNWNDRIDSFQVLSANNRRGRGPFWRDRDDRDETSNGPARDRICVYEDPNFGGRSQCWDAGEEELNLNRVNGWNDRISSIRVFGRAQVEVYRNAEWRGERLRVSRDVPDLGALNWGDQISSFQVR